MKRFLVILLTFSLLMSVCAPTALAADTVAEGTCGEKVTWRLDGDGILTISGTGATEDFSAAAPWAAYKAQIKSAIVGEGVTRLGNYAFSGCGNLTNVSLPSSLTELGDEAFRACHSLRRITIPNGVTRLGDRAFFACSGLTEVRLSAKLERIGGYAFESCTALRQIELPQGMTELAAGAFKGCTALEHIELPSSVTHVTASLFYECESLKSAVLPDSIESIASEAFSYSGLESISVPASVKTVYQTAFQECFALKSAEIAAEEVGIGAFLDCWALKNVTFGRTVKKLGKNIFGGCTSLTEVSFLGAKPELADNTFNEVAATVGYPEEADDAVTWTDEARQNYGGELTWERRHDLEHVPAKEPTCTEAGNSEYWGCLVCGKCFADAACRTEITNPKLPALPHIWDEGRVTHAATTEAEGVRTFTCTRCKLTRTEPVAKLQLTVSFKDVDKESYYAAAVEWAVEKNITKGTAADTFAPNDTCTRGQIVTFLWRAAEEPKPSDTENPFTDIQQSDYWYNAVLWAVEQGITTGTSTATFSPNEGCTRGQVAAFLWRYENKPAPTVKNPFEDVKAGAYYYDAVLWALEANVTKGTSATTFAPNDTCTRGQIVTFLYRDIA